MATGPPSGITYQKAHIGDDKRIGISVSDAICYGLALVSVLLRVYSRHLAQTKHKADDWWIYCALVSHLRSQPVVMLGSDC